ncbi:MAG: alpha-L-rhamnosidase-related protein, partial [Promethearchaeota archaeon]
IIDDQDYHLDTGIIVTRYLFDVLAKYDLNDVAYKIITQKSYPGWYYMIREGATTLWERWEKLEKGGMNSHNHAMLGSVDTWFYKHLVGIQPIEPGWKKIKIKPFFPDDMKFATASIESLYGIISVSWEKYEKNLKIIISIPVNSEGELWIKMDNKKLTVFESEEIIWKENGVNGDVDGINTIFKNKNYLIIHFGSGNYRFLIQNE